MGDRFRAALTALRRSEQGIALPMAMMITVIAMGIAAVPIVASVSSQGGDTRNERGNQALAAAEAGAELAILNQSKLVAEDPDAYCVGGASLVGAGWCPEVGPEPIGLAEYRYEVRPCYGGVTGEDCVEASDQAECVDPTGGPVQVVAVGISNEVTKRIEVTGCAGASSAPTQEELELAERVIERETIEKAMKEEEENGTATEEIPGDVLIEEKDVTYPPPDVFAGGQIVGIDWLDMSNNAQVYNGGAGSNGWVKMVGSANVCGTVQYGTTWSTDNSSSNTKPSGCAGRTFSKGTTEYPPVSPPKDIATNNSNSRLAAADPVCCNIWQRGNVSWNASNRKLTVNYEKLTLEGTLPYYLCQLTLAGGSKLLSGSGKSIRIFFDAPSNCPGLNGAPQLQFANGTEIGADSNHGPGLYFVGSSTNYESSKIELAGGAYTSQFVIYAPNSKIVANNGVNLSGVIIGRTLELAGGASINKSGKFTPPSTGDFLESKTEKVKTETPGETKIVSSKTWIQHEEELEAVKERITELEAIIGESGGTATKSVTKKLFVECTAAEPGPSEAPDSGC